MPIETFNFLDSLNASNPPTSDGLVGGDDHIRGIKATLQATFPGVNAAATRVSGGAWGFLTADGSVTAPSYSFVNEPTIGIFRSSAGVMTAKGVFRPFSDIGMLADFACATPPAGWIECDGQAISRTTFADLFAVIGTTWGAGNGSTTFNLPDFRFRYRRHRDGGAISGVVGAYQSPKNLTHTHPVSGTTTIESATHTHPFSTTSSTMNSNTSHSHTYTNSSGTAFSVTGGGSFSLPINNFTDTTSTVNIDHTHFLSGTTGAENTNHTHNLSVTSGTGSNDDANEARPFSATVLTCIRF